MLETLDRYKDQLNFQYFDDVSKIPRMSFHEERMADYLERFSKDHGLWYHRDQIGNVIIKKPGANGKEHAEPIILQAHMDMVCEKEPGFSHDFLTDPIDVFIEDGWMKARGTTLGADDGAGVANILGILSEPGLTHPPLECVFTVQEENGMGGAKSLDFSLLNSRRMIGLDGIEEGTTINSASAVYGGQIKKNIVIDTAEHDTTVFALTVEGLTSGHGALNIGNEQANAIKVAARILYHLNQSFDIKLRDIQGGGLIHVIPRECSAIFETDSDTSAAEVFAAVEKLAGPIKAEYASTDPDMAVHCDIVPVKTGISIEKKCSNEILGLLYLIPAGAAKRNPKHLERVEGSWNISIVRMADKKIVLDDICRANYPVTTGELKSIVHVYAKMFDAVYEETFRYPGYCVPEDSPLTKIWEEVYEKHSGEKLKKVYLHSALDAGTIYNGLNKIDLIVVAPTVLDVHTPRERMNVESFSRTYRYLKDILARA